MDHPSNSTIVSSFRTYPTAVVPRLRSISLALITHSPVMGDLLASDVISARCDPPISASALFFIDGSQCEGESVFGKDCEYELPYGSTLEQTLDWQMEMRNADEWKVQIYGNITCYDGISCNSGVLCLDWREICDGIQNCMYRHDEENCDILEMNMCDEDEYRCSNGLCIPDAYFLDGELDCLDWTDEMRSWQGSH